MWLAVTQVAQQPAPPSPVELFQGGILIGVIVLFLKGDIWAGHVVKRLIADRERLIEEQLNRQKELTDEVKVLTSKVERLTVRLEAVEGRRPGDRSRSP